VQLGAEHGDLERARTKAPIRAGTVHDISLHRTPFELDARTIRGHSADAPPRARAERQAASFREAQKERLGRLSLQPAAGLTALACDLERSRGVPAQQEDDASGHGQQGEREQSQPVGPGAA
jgi:hypothetical protein